MLAMRRGRDSHAPAYATSSPARGLDNGLARTLVAAFCWRAKVLNDPAF